MPELNGKIGAVVLAAGLSQRMGKPKMLLPWGDRPIIVRVVETLLAANVDEVRVVTGGAGSFVEAALIGKPVRCVFNPNFKSGEMLTSLQVGLGNLSGSVETCLIVLGDQPQIEEEVVRTVLGAYRTQPSSPLIIPSYKMRRGHPWLIRKELWPEIQAMKPPETLRDFLNHHQREITYIKVNTPSILADLDTPEQYHQQKPQS